MASRYWVGGTASWDATAGTKWALTSGGAGGQTVPGVGDDVFFDAASGTVTVTSTIAQSVQSLDFNGFTGTFNWSANNITINGTAAVMRFSSGMTLTASSARQILCVNTSGTITLTTNGKTFGTLVRSGVGGSTVLGDALTLTAGLTVSGGTFDNSGNYSVSMAGSFSSTGSSVRSLTLGTATYTLSGVVSAWSISGSNITYGITGASIVFSATGSGDRIFTVASIADAYASVSLVNVTTSALIALTNLRTVDFTVGQGWILEMNNNNVFTNPPTMVGTAAHPIMINNGSGTSSGSQGAMSCASGTLAGDYLIIRDNAASGGATFNATNSVDFGNNTGWNITPPAGGMASPMHGMAVT